jgi:hypothetical protein
MHICLLQIYDYASLYIDLPLIIGRGHVLQSCLNKDRLFHHAYVIHSAMPCLHVLLVPEWCMNC